MPSSYELQPLKDEGYASAYVVFLKNWQINRKAALDVMQQHLSPPSADQHAVSVLSVGPGPGDFDQQVIGLLRHRYPERAIAYLAVEPNPVHRQLFTAALQASELQNISVDLRPLRFEALQISARFECIHFTHSFYDMPGQEKELIRKGMRMLKPQGFLLIVMTKEEAMMFNLIFRYLEQTGNLGRADFPPIPGANQLMAMLSELGLVYEQTELDEFVDVTPCFTEASPEALPLLDFVFQAQVSQCPAEMQQLALTLLADAVVERNGRKLLSAPSAAIVVPAQ